MAHPMFDGDDRQALPRRRIAPPRASETPGPGFDVDMDAQAVAARIDELKRLLGSLDDRRPAPQRRAA